MSLRDWGHIGALGLVALVAVLLYYASAIAIAGGSYFCANDDRDKPRYYTAEQPDTAKPFSPRSSKDQSPKRTYQEARCDGSDDKEAYANCQAWRSARAAEEQACIARTQTYLSVGAVALVLATLIANAISAFGGVAAVGEMRKSSERQLRAYVTLKPGNVVFAKGVPISVEMRVTNTGETPAYNIVILNNFVFLPYPVLPPNAPPKAPNVGESSNVLAKGDFLPADRPLGIPINPVQMALMRLGSHRWYVTGVVRYQDVFGRDRYANLLASAPNDLMLKAVRGVDNIDMKWEYTAKHNDAN